MESASGRLSVIARWGCFVWLAVTLLAPRVLASKKEAEAASLIDRAKQLSDIRAEGAPAFRLRINLRLTDKDGSTHDGAYAETWVSKTQWRRETKLGDFRRTEVASGRKLWRLDSATTMPERIKDVLGFFEISKPTPQMQDYLKPAEIEDQQIRGTSARCIEIRTGFLVTSALCFDKDNGMLAAELQPLRVESRVAAKDCVFSNYRKFGDRIVAGSYDCYEDGHLRFQARVVEIAAESAPDPRSFTALDGASESVNCLGAVKPGELIDKVDPRRPLAVNVQSRAFIRATIGTDGKLHDLRVVFSPNPEFSESALQALKQWRYKPYTCDGEPVEVDTEVTVDFGFFRP